MPRQELETHVICLDTLRSLMSDLDRCIVSLLSEVNPEKSAEEYVKVMTYIWQCATGEDMRMDDALEIFNSMHLGEDTDDD